MVSFKKYCAFFQNQLLQIKKDGLRTLHRKLKKFWQWSWMSLTTAVAAYFRIDWPQADDFLIHKALRRIKKLRLNPETDKAYLDRQIDRLIDLLKRRVQNDPDLSGLQDWIRKNTLLAGLYEIKNEIKKYMEVCAGIDQIQHRITKRHRLDDIGIEFVPRAIALGSIGVYENLEVYLKARILEGRSDKKLILLLSSNAQVNNPCYLKYWSRYVTIISDPELIEMLEPLEARLTVPMVSFMQFRGKLYKSTLALGEVRQQWVEENHGPILTLSIEDYERGWDCLHSLGVPRDAWFVTLHVRSPGWRDDGSKEESFRNADINTYIPAIKAITDAGGWVVRIGDPAMTNLPSMPRVIDYAHSQSKSDWMDVFLCAQCRFLIGTSSGMFVLAMSFGVPVVVTNLLPACAMYHFTSQDMCIPKNCFDANKEQYLSFSELLSPPVGTARTQSYFDQNHIKVVANTAQEIKELVEEMLEKCAGRLTYSKEDEVLQKRFQETAADCGKLYGDLSLATNGRIGRDFLRKFSKESLIICSKH